MKIMSIKFLLIFYLIIIDKYLVSCQTVNYFETFFTNDDEVDVDTNFEVNPFNFGRNAIKLNKYKWPNGLVPYLISENYTQEEHNAVLESFKVFHKETCVTFIPKQESDVVHIKFVKSKSECGSLVGYRPNRIQSLDVILSDDCIKLLGAIQHELLHVLGLLHEHCRNDRDDYINIFWDNIEPEYKKNFQQGPSDVFETFGLPYDYESLMHYPKNAYAKNNSLITMESKVNPNMELGQWNEPTFLDMEKIRRMYDC